MHYGEMLECVGKIERMKLKEVMEKSLVFSVQIDGCVSRTLRYNKFVSSRTLSRKIELQTFFLGVHAPSKDGAEGLLESLLAIFDNLESDTNKLAAVTTDSEKCQHRKTWRSLAITLRSLLSKAVVILVLCTQIGSSD